MLPLERSTDTNYDPRKIRVNCGVVDTKHNIWQQYAPLLLHLPVDTIARMMDEANNRGEGRSMGYGTFSSSIVSGVEATLVAAASVVSAVSSLDSVGAVESSLVVSFSSVDSGDE